MNIEEHESFIKHSCTLLFSIIGGSHLYGLNTISSDVDYRAIFVARNKLHIAGFSTIESIVSSSPVDYAAYELGRFLHLLRKSNTQVLELLHAPESAYMVRHPVFDMLLAYKDKLVDTQVLKNSLTGYVFSELKLAKGARTGRLGGKRKAALDQYGFSYKNFVQILRLCAVGKRFFETGEYMVCVRERDEALHAQLLDIKTHPANYTAVQLEAMVDEAFAEMRTAMNSSDLRMEFDVELAADILIAARNYNYEQQA